VAINLFLLWNIRTGGADDLEEFDCIGRDRQVLGRRLVIFLSGHFERHLLLHVLGKTLYSHSQCLSPPGVYMGTSKLNAGR